MNTKKEPLRPCETRKNTVVSGSAISVLCKLIVYKIVTKLRIERIFSFHSISGGSLATLLPASPPCVESLAAEALLHLFLPRPHVWRAWRRKPCGPSSCLAPHVWRAWRRKPFGPSSCLAPMCGGLGGGSLAAPLPASPSHVWRAWRRGRVRPCRRWCGVGFFYFLMTFTALPSFTTMLMPCCILSVRTPLMV